MPFIRKDIKDVREDFVKEFLEHKTSKTALCQKYNISRPTGDKWIGRYQNGESLSDKSKAPKKPNKVDSEIEALIVEKRKEFPAFGAAKIIKILENEGYTNLPCAKTANNIFRRNGLITKEASAAATPYIRFEKSYPNEMWQCDFNGDFAMRNGKRCHILDITDDFSRYNICCKGCHTETYDEVMPIIIELFENFGQPFSFLCDNGNPWGTSQSMGYTKLETWFMEHGILVIHCRIKHPQTQGKDERFNGSLQRECLKYNTFYDLEDAQIKLDKYRDIYNNIRPHHALNLEIPASRFRKSNTEYSPTVKKWLYPEGCLIRKVKETGYFNYRNQAYFLSEAFGGKEIALKESERENCIDILFRKFIIGRLNIDKRSYEFKKAYLIDGDPRRK